MALSIATIILALFLYDKMIKFQERKAAEKLALRNALILDNKMSPEIAESALSVG